ncbi:MAG TPA: hypothetical protein VK525_11170 [Candidatus Saccharimonadales bacterium]|nr:hypothetical protein [Candidatus Saccharimonadales bacterium]
MRGSLRKVCAQVLSFAVLLGILGFSARAQEKQHVVSLDELSKDAAKPAQTRQSDEGAIRSLLSSDAGQQALKSANVEYGKVDKAISQMSDGDVARLAERSRQAQSDFAAGSLSNRDLLWIILIIVAVIIIALAVR